MKGKIIAIGIAVELTNPVKDKIIADELVARIPKPRNIGKRTPYLVQSSSGFR